MGRRNVNGTLSERLIRMCHVAKAGWYKEATIHATKALFDSGRMNYPKACLIDDKASKKEEACCGESKSEMKKRLDMYDTMSLDASEECQESRTLKFYRTFDIAVKRILRKP
jgi:hypothetical protein